MAPNGSRVAFTRFDLDPPMLETLRLDGTNPHLIGPGTSPTFSPDGRRLGYAAPDGTIHMVVHFADPAACERIRYRPAPGLVAVPVRRSHAVPRP